MVVVRAALALSIAYFLATGVAFARDSTGIDRSADAESVTYLNVNDAGGTLSGGVQIVSTDLAEDGGVRRELDDTLSRERPKAVRALAQARSELARAQKEKRDAEAVVVRLRTIAAQKHATAGAADAAATNAGEHAAADRLGYVANQADYDANNAQYNVQAAQYDIEAALRDIDNADAALQRVDARIAQLRGSITQDREVLAHP